MNTMTITGPAEPGFENILTPQALDFLAALHEEFAPALRELLTARAGLPGVRDRGSLPRAVDTVRTAAEAPHPSSVSAPPLGGEAVYALDSSAQVWLADLADGMSPRWDNIVTAQINLKAAVRGHLDVVDPRGGHRLHRTQVRRPQITLRPRRLEVEEEHLVFTAADGTQSAANAALCDFGLYFFHNAGHLEVAGERPVFLLSGLRSSEEALWWKRVFAHAQEYRGFDDGLIGAQIALDNPDAALDLDDIAHVFGEHFYGAVPAVRGFAAIVLGALHHEPASLVECWTAADDSPDFLHTVLARLLDDTAASGAGEGAEAVISDTEMRAMIRLSLDQLAHWLRGIAVRTDSLTSAASTELSRTQLWIAVRRRAELDTGVSLTPGVFSRMMAEELAVTLRDAADYYCDAADLLSAAVLSDSFEPTLFERAYRDFLVDRQARSHTARRTARLNRAAA